MALQLDHLERRLASLRATGSSGPICVFYDPRFTSPEELARSIEFSRGLVTIPATGPLSAAQEAFLHKTVAGRQVLFLNVRKEQREHVCRRWNCRPFTIPPPPPRPRESVEVELAESVAGLLDEAKRRQADGKKPAALRLIYDTLDTWLLSRKWGEADTALAMIDVNEFELDVLIGFLTITLPWGPQLPSRSALAQRVREKAEKMLPPDRVALALGGLE